MKSVLAQEPFVIDHAEGVYVYDEKGHRYLDAHAGLWLVNVGYGRQEIIEAMHTQAQKLAWFSSFGGIANRPSLDLAEYLVERLSPDGMVAVFFSNDGSEAVETALKLSRQYWKIRGRGTKTKFIGREKSYHGVTLGALSVAGISANRTAFEPLLADVRHTAAPDVFHCPHHPGDSLCTGGCIRELERLIGFENPDTIAAMILEPIQAAGGVIIPPPDYVRQVAELCRQHDILLIADEVVTGFGRLGDWTGSRHYGIRPDMMTFAKGITSGYMPLGATAVTREIWETFRQVPGDGPEFRHGNTYSGHPVACAAALANLAIIEREQLWLQAREIGPYLRKKLQEAENTWPQYLSEAGAEGLLGRIRIQGGTDAVEPGYWGLQVQAEMRRRGVIVRVAGDVVTFSPPLIVTADHIDVIISTLVDSVAAIFAP